MQHEPLPFAYEVAGCVNGAPVALRIAGSVARHEVQFEARFTSGGEQLLCDEQILALVAIDPVVLLSLDPGGVEPDAAPEIFRIESSILDEGQKAVGRFVLAGCWSVEQGQLVIRAQIVKGRLRFEPLERVTRVGVSSPMSLLSAEMERVVATRTWSVGTSRGNSYSGTSVSRGTSLAFGREVRERVLRLRWTGVAGGEATASRARRAYRVAVEGEARA